MTRTPSFQPLRPVSRCSIVILFKFSKVLREKTAETLATALLPINYKTASGAHNATAKDETEAFIRYRSRGLRRVARDASLKGGRSFSMAEERIVNDRVERNTESKRERVSRIPFSFSQTGRRVLTMAMMVRVWAEASGRVRWWNLYAKSARNFISSFIEREPQAAAAAKEKRENDFVHGNREERVRTVAAEERGKKGGHSRRDTRRREAKRKGSITHIHPLP